MITFPTSLDSFVTRVLGVVIQPDDVNDLQSAIEALEAKVGITSSAVNTTFDFKLSGVADGDKAMSKTGTETGTNKTFTSPVLNTPVINVGSDANYDLYYRFNGVFTRLPIVSGKILKSTGGVLVWETETTVVDASATVKGVTEIATAAEINAGTATGSTGAPLAITPDQLALSAPAFDGSNLTAIPKVPLVAVSSANLRLSADTERTQSSSFGGATMVEVKRISVPLSGTISVSFDIKDASGYGGNGRIYIDGVATGTIRISTASYFTYTEDIKVKAGSFVQLYTQYGAGQTTACRNFRISYDRSLAGYGEVITD